MSRRYFALIACSLGLVLFGVHQVAGAPQESKPATPPVESPKTPPGSGLFSALFESKLERALKRGLKPEGSIAKELEKLDVVEISSMNDAKAICDTLATLLQREAENIPVPSRDFDELTSLFIAPNSSDRASEELKQRGVPLLMKLYDRQLTRLEPENEGHLVRALMTMAALKTGEGCEERVLAALQRQLGANDFYWDNIFDALFTPPIASEDFLRQIRENPPAGRIGLALVMEANQASLDGYLPSHPFDSAVGRDRLRVWLTSQIDSYSAYSAAVALAFVSKEIRNQLLPLALEHSDPSVQMEAAWAAGRQGDERGLRMLVRYCRELEFSARAQEYLKELNREDLVPEDAKDPEFIARAEFSEWLQHPNELGESPDEIEVIDRRELKWPLEEEPRTIWLLRYLLKDSLGLDPDDVGCGLVGSVTWCFFDPDMLRRPPEDVYAFHCCWEMEQAELIQVREAESPELSDELVKLLKRPIEEPSLLASARVASKLQLPSRKFYVAEGKLDGAEGWLLFADSETAWYPKSEHPESTSAETILRLHLGGKLLGFKEKPNRKEYLSRQLPKRTPAEFVSAYEQLMDEFWEASAAEQAMLLAENTLTERFDDYLEALVATKGGKKEQYLLEKYSEFLDWAESVDEPAREQALSNNDLIAEQFEAYVTALISSGDSETVPTLCERLAPHWNYWGGYSRLGNAAHRVGRLDLAEKWFEKVAEEVEYRHFELDMCLLAEILHRRGATEKAKELLVDCLGKLAGEIREAEDESQLSRVRQLYGTYRETYLKLFPKGASELEAKGLPENPGRSGNK